MMKTQEAPANEVRPQGPEANRRRVRPWLILTVVAAATAAFGLGVLVGSGDSDGEPTTVETPAIVDDWGAAFVAEDPQALAALYADGATFNCRAWDFTIGGEEISDVVMGDGTDFTEFEAMTVLAGEEIIVAEYMVTAVSPAGQSISTPLIAVFDVTADGLLAGSTIDYDRAAMFPDEARR